MGMTFDFSTTGEVKALKNQYIKDIIDNLPEELGTTAVNPSGYHLFKEREGEDFKPFTEQQAVMFHHMVEKILFFAINLEDMFKLPLLS